MLVKPQCVSLQPTTALCLPLQAAVQWTGHPPADAAERVQGQQASVHGERGAAVEAAQRRPAGESPPPLTHLTLQLATELCLLPHNCALIAQITPPTTTPASWFCSSPSQAWQRLKLFQILRKTWVTAVLCRILLMNIWNNKLHSRLLFWARKDVALAQMHLRLSVGLSLLSISLYQVTVLQ